jgi:hypothetical protein
LSRFSTGKVCQKKILPEGWRFFFEQPVGLDLDGTESAQLSLLLEMKKLGLFREPLDK